MGKFKAKGTFVSGLTDYMHNPTGNIITDAVIKYFDDGTSVEETIKGCNDIRQFIIVRTVKGGAVKDNVDLGKNIRWYYSNTSEGAIHYRENGNTVPKSEGGKPIMNISDEFPDDVNYQVYIDEARKVLSELDEPCVSGRNRHVDHLQSRGLCVVPVDHKGVKVVPFGTDFSSVSKVAFQTGYRAGVIAIKGDINFQTMTIGDWSLFKFENQKFPSAMKPIKKKANLDVLYGGIIPPDEIEALEIHGEMQPLPIEIEDLIFRNLPLANRRKIVDGYECLL